jgi:hypothetical protein
MPERRDALTPYEHKHAHNRIAGHNKERSLANFLLEELWSFTGEGWEQEDDITLLTLRRSLTPS